MAKTQGLVSEIKLQETSVGTMYNFIINGETFGGGKFPPKGIKAGDYIEFEFTENGRYKNMNSKSVVKIDKPVNVAAPAVTSGPANFPVVTKNWGKDQEIISKQAARNTAIAFLTVLASQDAIPVAASAKSGVKFDAIRALLEKLTEEFFDYSQGKSSTPLTDAAKNATMATPADGDPWDDKLDI